MTILDLGKFLNKLFKSLNINIYPIIAENSTKFPYAVYSRDSFSHNHKDKSINKATYSIDILSEQYNESVMLLQKFLDECREIQMFNNETIRISVVSSNEVYSGEAYVQSIIIDIEIN